MDGGQWCAFRFLAFYFSSVFGTRFLLVSFFLKWNSCWFLRFAYSVLRRFLPEEKVEQLKGLALTADGKGAVFDVPAEDVDLFIAGISLIDDHINL